MESKHHTRFAQAKWCQLLLSSSQLLRALRGGPRTQVLVGRLRSQVPRQHQRSIPQRGSHAQLVRVVPRTRQLVRLQTAVDVRAG